MFWKKSKEIEQLYKDKRELLEQLETEKQRASSYYTSNEGYKSKYNNILDKYEKYQMAYDKLYKECNEARAELKKLKKTLEGGRIKGEHCAFCKHSYKDFSNNDYVAKTICMLDCKCNDFEKAGDL